MLKALIKKEFALTAHPMTYFMAFFGVMLLIPNYPYYVSFFYTTLGLFFAFMSGRENRDLYFSVILPVTKNDIVTAKTLFVYMVETVSVIFAVPFAFITNKINPNGGNAVGIEANVAFFGFSLIMLGIFNLIFLLSYFRTPYKVGKAYLISSIFMFIYIGILEALVHFPVIGEYLDTAEYGKMLSQLPILIIGILFYVLSGVIIIRNGTKRFEHTDL